MVYIQELSSQENLSGTCQVMKLDIRKSKPTDLQEVKNLLQNVNLPVDGVKDQFQNYFVVEIQNTNKIIGVMGWEQYDSFGLVRSAAISPEFQNKGLGSKLVLKIHKDAREKGIKKLYLLTETAEDFSAKHGFKVVKRSEVPKQIIDSNEFSMRECKSALAMMREI